MWPDCPGNATFNTLGNLAVESRAGLLFVDFENGDTLQVGGRAGVIWEEGGAAEFAGAERVERRWYLHSYRSSSHRLSGLGDT